MICEFCGENTEKRKVRKQHWFQGKLYLIENVAAEVCTECGERYFHARDLDRIDQRLSKEHTVKERLQIEVVKI